jgi:hypothetical protein
MTVWLCVILSRPERGALSAEAETTGFSRFVIPAQAGIQFSAPGFRVAAYGLARNDGLPRVAGTG